MPMPTKSPAAIAFAIVAFTWLSGRMAAGAKSIPGVPPSNPLATKSSANARPTTAAEVAQSRKRPSRGSAGRAADARRNTIASTAASATAQSPTSKPLMPPALTAASAGGSEVARSKAEKVRWVYVTHGRKNATSASDAPASPTRRAREKLMSGPPAWCGAVRGDGDVRGDVRDVGAGRVEGRANRAQDVAEITVQRRDEVRAAREDACLPRAADLAVDDVHVLGTPERVERPLCAHLDAGLAIPARGARRGPHVTRRLAVRLAGAAVREQERHDDVLAAPGGAPEDALDLAEDAVAIAAEECRDVVGLDLEAGVFESLDRVEDDRHVPVGHGIEREPRAEEGWSLWGDRHCFPPPV